MLGLSSGRIEDVGTDETPCRRRLNHIKIINKCKKKKISLSQLIHISVNDLCKYVGISCIYKSAGR